MEKVLENVYADTRLGKGGNIGAIIYEDKVIFIDAGFPAIAREAKNEIMKLTSKPITHLILTHYHADHTFGCQEFKECKIISHRKLREIMEENMKTIWRKEELKNLIERVKVERPESAWLYEGLSEIIPPNEVFDDKYTLEDMEIINVGGHTEDSSIIYIKDKEILFSGDIIFSHSFPWGGDPTADPDKWIKTLKMILEMKIKKIIPGHGPICGKEEVEKYLNFMEKVKMEVKELSEKGLGKNEIMDIISKIEFYQPLRLEMKKRTLEYWIDFWIRKL
ncbi:MAG: MBL fold metallo-hydrolase [Candidatus Methanomethylicia archaeon]